MAAPTRDDSMLQVLERQQKRRRQEIRIRSSRREQDGIGRQVRRRQAENAPAPTIDSGSQADGAPVATLVLTETLATPFATLTTIVTVGPPTSELDPRPTFGMSGENLDSPVSSGRPATATAAGRSNTAQPKSRGVGSTPSPTMGASSPTTISPTTTAASNSQSGSSGGSGIDIKALVPAIVGGAIFLIIVAFLLGFCIRKRGRKREGDSDPEVVNEIERRDDETDGGYGTSGSTVPSRGGRLNEKRPSQVESIDLVPDINVDASHARSRSLSKGTSQSREGLLQNDYSKLMAGGLYSSEREKRQAMAMLRRSTAQDSATIPVHLRNLRPESMSTDGPKSPGFPTRPSEEGEPPMFLRPTNSTSGERISKIGMALSTSDKSLQDDGISTIMETDTRPSAPMPSTMFFEETPPLYSVTSSAPDDNYFGSSGGAARSSNKPKSSSNYPPEHQPEFNTVGSANSSNRSRFAGRSDLATPSPPGSPTRSSRDHDRDTSTSSRRSSMRGSGIFGLSAAKAVASETRKMRPKSWDRKARRYDRKRQSRGRGVGNPSGLEKPKGNKNRSRSRGNTMWTAWFDSSSEGEEEASQDVIEPIPLPGGIVTSKSQRKKRVLFNSTSDISENPTVSSARTLTNNPP
ncbi:hypothetical protein Dda_2843 [Drechslerella dactyloides]|uniref:Uncharacterized protein n=1 Tax=Drechslerella dactyloides TaxID=74499 RepID=A0AAD6J0R7_DREDA|nr:hypothetical protein Dda_2843 [Drechslerella dactyloides]